MEADNVILILGAIAGTLTGAISFLFKALIESKDNRINELVDDRDYWRDQVLKEHEIDSYEDWLKEHSPPPVTPPPSRPGKV